MIDSLKKIFFILDISDKKNILINLFLFLLVTLCDLLSISLMVPIIASLINEKNNLYTQIIIETLELESLNQNELIISFCGLLVLIYLIKSIIKVMQIYFINHTSHNLFIKNSKKILNNYLQNKLKFFTGNNSSVLIRNIQSECNLFAYSIIYPLLVIMAELILFIFVSIFLLLFNFKISILSIFLFTLIPLVFLKFTSKKIKKWGETRQNFSSLTLKSLQEVFFSIKEIFIYDLKNYFVKKFDFNNSKFSESTKMRNILNSLPRIIIEFFIVVILVFIIFYMIKSSNDLSEVLISIGVFSFAAIKLMPSISLLTSQYQLMKYNIPVVDVLFEEIKKANQKQNNLLKDKCNLNENFENLNFKDLSFGYENKNKDLFKKINIEINKKDKIGIIGETGIGKSSFINLICGLFDDYSGKIFYNKKELRQNNLDIYKSFFSYVPQHVYLLDDTILNNIIFGVTERKINKKKIEKIIKIVELENTINQLPNKLDTIVGEGGSKLSGGQIQRIGIARALYKDRSILILDESTSALDEKTEINILKSLFENYSEKTILVITHRKKPLEYCQRLLEIKNQLIIEQKK